MKSDFVEVAFAMNGRYRNIRNVRVVAVAGSAPRVDRQPTTQPERTAQAVEFVTISPEEEEEIQHALAKKNAAILNESIETARELLTNRGVSDAVTADNVVRLAVLLAERRIVHVSRVYDDYLRAKVAAMRAPPAPPATTASRASAINTIAIHTERHEAKEQSSPHSQDSGCGSSQPDCGESRGHQARPRSTRRIDSEEASKVDENGGLRRRLLRPLDENERREMEERRRRELFGDVVFSYTDDQAVDDGVLKRFLTPQGRDTHHRITVNAYEQLTEHHRPSYPDYTETDFMRFYLAELLSLVPEAVRVYERNIGGGILKTDFDFRVTKASGDVLWYVPNEVGGVTMMKPEDY
jgi:hypothetical protein